MKWGGEGFHLLKSLHTYCGCLCSCFSGFRLFLQQIQMETKPQVRCPPEIRLASPGRVWLLSSHSPAGLVSPSPWHDSIRTSC